MSLASSGRNSRDTAQHQQCRMTPEAKRRHPPPPHGKPIGDSFPVDPEFQDENNRTIKTTSWALPRGHVPYSFPKSENSPTTCAQRRLLGGQRAE